MSVARYLDRLGLDPDPEPTLETLRQIHTAHLERVPYENLAIMLGRPPSVTSADALDRVATTGHGGYCFHQNGAVEPVLRALGYAVERRHGHVWRDPLDREATSLNHLVLVVSGLPTEANPEGRWWPDLGLGDGFYEPLPLVPGTHRDGPFTYQLHDVRQDGWDFRHDPSGSFAGVEVRALPIGADRVEEAHRGMSTPPDGSFTRVLVVARRHRGGQDTLRGCVLTRIDATGSATTDLTSYDEWRGALELLRLPMEVVDPAGLYVLWERMLVAHRAWDAAGRP